MDIPVKKTCPLGHQCQKTVDGGYIEECMWYIKMQGKHPLTGENVDEMNCEIAWQPIFPNVVSG